MEEDIKILEEKVELYYDCAVIDEDGFDMRVDIAFMKKDAQALENLIKGYRELGRLYKSEKEMKIRYVGYYQDLLLKENCIPNSKITEKIEEYKKKAEEYEEKKKDDVMGFWQIEFLKACHKYQALQELIEGK